MVVRKNDSILAMPLSLYLYYLFKCPGPSCSKLTMSLVLVNHSLKFRARDMHCKANHIFSAKNIIILYIESAKTVNEMTLNELIKLTML